MRIFYKINRIAVEFGNGYTVVQYDIVYLATQ